METSKLALNIERHFPRYPPTQEDWPCLWRCLGRKRRQTPHAQGPSWEAPVAKYWITWRSWYIDCSLDYKTQFIEIMVDPSTGYISICDSIVERVTSKSLQLEVFQNTKWLCLCFWGAPKINKYFNATGQSCLIAYRPIIFRYQTPSCWNCAWVRPKWATSKLLGFSSCVPSNRSVIFHILHIS